VSVLNLRDQHWVATFLESLPTGPGVYLMKDGAGRVIYVGKARSLRARVSSYFGAGSRTNPKTLVMMGKMASIDYVLTGTEIEALMLENTLIKKHKPRYNVMLRDDKNFPYLRLSLDEDFPRLSVVRRVLRDKAMYFGPYVSAGSMRTTLRLLRQIFPIAVCNARITRTNVRPCLQFEMGRCLAPCSGQITKEEYRNVVHDLVLFLKGRNTELLRRLKEKMRRAAEELRFEEAARVRNQIRAIERVIANQKVATTGLTDQDVIGIAASGPGANVQIFFLRGGQLLGSRTFDFDDVEGLETGEILSSFVKQYYGRDRFIPREIVLTCRPADGDVLGRWLTEQRGGAVSLSVPQRGKKRHLAEMALKNAEVALDRGRAEVEEARSVLGEVQEVLKLPKPPRRVETFDVSNIGGSYAVGAVVVFEDGAPKRSDYRRFRIRTVEGADDYAMMREIVHRRYGRLLRERAEVPDLVVIDGGRGHLNAARSVLEEMGVGDVPIVAFAKGGSRAHGESAPDAGLARDEIYMPSQAAPVCLSERSPVQHFLERLRDEAHRFAVRYHRRVRAGEELHSRLEDVPGVGPKRRAALLARFGSLRRIREATVEELAATPGIGEPLAREILARV